MTALKSLGSNDSPSSQKVPGMAHKCLRRKSRRTYELLDPKNPREAISFDIGQIKEIVLMDKPEDGVVTSVPAGYAEFAARFNECATGPERFATYTFVEDRPVICKDGSPIVWEQFLIDNSLVGWHSDPPSVSEFSDAALIAPQSPPSVLLERAPGNPQLHALSEHLKAALATTDELTKFWIERGAIEHQYASRLAKLAEKPIGQNEPSEFRNAIDGFRMEVARQAMAHNTLATKIAVDLESRCLTLQASQRAHFHEIYEPAARKLLDESVQENSPYAGVSSEWKNEYRNLRHFLDSRRLDALREGRNHHDIPVWRSNYSLDDLELGPMEPSPSQKQDWGKDWEELRDSCEEMEANRSQFMKDVLSAYADVLSSIRAADHESYENIIHTFDLFKPEDVLDEFTQNFKSGKNSKSDVRPSSLSFAGFSGVPTPALPVHSPVSRPLPDPRVVVKAKASVSAKTISTSNQSPSRLMNSRSRPPDIRLRSTRLSGSLSQTIHTASDVQRHVRPSLPKLSTDFPRTHIA